MKQELIQARIELDGIPVAGDAVKHMFVAQSLIEQVISQMPDDIPPAKGKDKEKKAKAKEESNG